MGSYLSVIGAWWSNNPNPGSEIPGNNSSFSTITSTAGGGGAGGYNQCGEDGGSLVVELEK